MTIETLAKELGMEAYALVALADMTDVGAAELTAEQEAFIRDLVAKTDADGTYTE